MDILNLINKHSNRLVDEKKFELDQQLVDYEEETRENFKDICGMLQPHFENRDIIKIETSYFDNDEIAFVKELFLTVQGDTRKVELKSSIDGYIFYTLIIHPSLKRKNEILNEKKNEKKNKTK